ncbi:MULTISPECIES: AAA family ATPase [unclassified Coleofasciculus]|uniref:AAA family ATPase n=1 Tax=unclassified Coleofasciculus TaxID=2692782 RepID=UPI00188261B6|nr:MULTISPECIES: AAA family ATPase [unclassified Coleofasciculus]MBE9126567.1 AAA family ATPase [Coleofasciculus sp. LEGE 07081]MBE9150001.1 AAA family ATPase [Coleofasciculus sp. LEGE 07092]
MYISKFQLFNYKSFRDSDLLEFTPGINIIVGANNSGKTALLEALTLSFEDVPHRSVKTLPSPDSIAEAQIRFNLKKSYFINLIKDLKCNLLFNKSSNYGTIEIPKSELAEDDIKQNNAEYLLQKWIEKTEDIKIDLYIPLLYYKDFVELTSGFKSSSDLIDNPKQTLYIGIQTPDNGQSEETIVDYLLLNFRENVYRFYAERLNIASCPFGNSSQLKPDASNLAEVLGVLQGQNPVRFERFNQHVLTIFPKIKWVSVRHQDNSTLEIMVWQIEPETEREDLSFPLSACGTGIGQVLAILYVVLTSQEPRTIIIDEPQSFLHPGAAKKLIEILKEFPQHQYIIATHSPMIIAAANPSTIVKLRYEAGETKTEVMNPDDIKEQRSLLADLGIRLSDIFGVDDILWVEGETEELCFPRILEELATNHLRGTQILKVRKTGDFEKKPAKAADAIFYIYDRLSSRVSLFPEQMRFVFDRENKSEEEIKRLEKERPNLFFLPRCMYENYLLHPKAIATLINQYDKSRDKCLTEEDVQQWIEDKQQNRSYLPQGVDKNSLSEDEWLCKVHGANLLKRLFAEFSETRVEFRKTTHSPELTDWLLEHEPHYLAELTKFLQEVLENKPLNRTRGKT